jgi:hypothetical protein
VNVHSDTENPQGGNPQRSEDEPLSPEKPSDTAHKAIPCLDNKQALTDYADALDKLWRR